ncbi:putative fatty acyl-CoA reductase CG5065 [Diorhabda sublineata]|uniref:putative fatty acyl-CoA reductase CG5065 n=1 Tax=Diorhabda sublineata TaxID=1163346 RepID=UPI0024E1199F|nr:putative fatty acyl-CoA reductase CG5065 [Diorhabda sublineata]
MPNVFNEIRSNTWNHIYDGRNSIVDFYKNTHILITGGTGFLGKALIEKLLRSCPDIKCIYLLLRHKKGKNEIERLDELLQNPVFDRIREFDGEIFKKIKPILGDVSLPNLGMNNEDLNVTIENLNIVFHSAATVKFNEDLKTALNYNTLGTKKVLDFCCNLKRLKSFVYVSTAFSNSDKENIEETVYETPYDPEEIFNIIDNLSDYDLQVYTKRLLKNHPNTYILTKSMAEFEVLKYSRALPCAIVRPSIITAAWKEPFPGWVDSISGITGIFMECGRGTIKSILCNEKYRMDIIPVDIVVSTLITSAWRTVKHRSNSLRVYNCTSGQINPITWCRFKELTLKYTRAFPSKYVTWYPSFTYRTSKIIHMILAIFYQILPSALLDIYLYAVGKKPIMLRISKKFYDALLAGSFSSTREWNFQVCTMKSLIKAVQNAPDGHKFEIDITINNGFQWAKYVETFNLGVRKYILKDDMKSMVEARKKLRRLYWFQKIIEVFTIYITLRTFFPYMKRYFTNYFERSMELQIFTD